MVKTGCNTCVFKCTSLLGRRLPALEARRQPYRSRWVGVWARLRCSFTWRSSAVAAHARFMNQCYTVADLHCMVVRGQGMPSAAPVKSDLLGKLVFSWYLCFSDWLFLVPVTTIHVAVFHRYKEKQIVFCWCVVLTCVLSVRQARVLYWHAFYQPCRHVIYLLNSLTTILKHIYIIEFYSCGNRGYIKYFNWNFSVDHWGIVKCCSHVLVVVLF